jgi:hypothetical protein
MTLNTEEQSEKINGEKNLNKTIDYSSEINPRLFKSRFERLIQKRTTETQNMFNKTIELSND